MNNKLEADLFRTWAVLVRRGSREDLNFVAQELEKRAKRLDEEDEEQK